MSITYIPVRLRKLVEQRAGESQQPYSSLLHVVRNAIAAKLTTAQETLERDRLELPILQKRVSQPFDQLQTYHEKANRLEFLKQLFDVIANEVPVDNDDQDRLLQFLQPQVFKSLSEFMLLEGGGKQLVIPQKNVNEEREQLKLF